MGIFNTTAKEVADERLQEARKGIQDLQNYLSIVTKEIDRHRELNQGRGFHIVWASGIMEKALVIYNEIARCNGAVLVRATEPSKIPNKNMIVCERKAGRCNICNASFPHGTGTCQDGHKLGKEYTSPC